MATKNRKRYQRRLDVGTLVALLVTGAVCAAGACGFVKVKNAHIECADVRRGLQQEISTLERELASVCGRIDTAYDRPALAAALKALGSELQPIRRTEAVAGTPSVEPSTVASVAGPDVGMTFINVENPSG